MECNETLEPTIITHVLGSLNCLFGSALGFTGFVVGPKGFAAFLGSGPSKNRPSSSFPSEPPYFLSRVSRE